MKSRHSIPILIMALGIWQGAMAQYAEAVASLDSSLILIGDQVRFHLELTVPSGSKVTWPMFNDTLVNRVEIIRRSPIDTVSSEKDRYTLRQELLITCFDSGFYVIPPIPFRFHQASDSTIYFTESQPIYLEVSTIETDQAADIKPIKPQLKAPLTFKEIAPWLAGVLALALIIAGTIYYLRKKKANQPVFQLRSKPKLPPHEIALEALENLKHKKLWQAGRVKDYYTEMTDVIRVYIEGRYDIRAPEMTTDEITAALTKTEAAAGSREKLRSALVSADLVKFAKARPLPMENDLHLNHCIEFVRETRPVADLREELAEVANNEGKS